MIAARVGLAAVLFLSLCANIAAGVTPEYAVKAAFLSKFGLFVAWPRHAAPTTDSIVVCVLGNNPFGDVLDKAVEGQRILERPLTVRYVRAVTRDTGCDILYAGASDEQSVTDALAAVSGTGVLTVTDSALGSGPHGIIDFVVRDKRVRFTIDDEAAARNGLTISSHLLSLALSVKSRN
jgi:hypothetical protein